MIPVLLCQGGHGCVSVRCRLPLRCLRCRCASGRGSLGAGVGQDMRRVLECGAENEQGVQVVLEGGGADDGEACRSPLCDSVRSRMRNGRNRSIEDALSVIILPLTRISARITCRIPSAESWSTLFHAMILPYVRTPCSAPSTPSGASAASTSRIRLFVCDARSMRAGSSIERRMYVLEPCVTAKQTNGQRVRPNCPRLLPEQESGQGKRRVTPFFLSPVTACRPPAVSSSPAPF